MSQSEAPFASGVVKTPVASPVSSIVAVVQNEPVLPVAVRFLASPNPIVFRLPSISDPLVPFANTRLVVSLPTVAAVSYTHLTLPTTPYV